jgi:hypothetical protein
MKITEIITEAKLPEPPKPRNFVAKNAMKTTSGAGAHKDKKRAEKQGEVKHKKQAVPMEGISEGSAHGYNVARWYEKNNDQGKLTKWLRKEAGLPKDAPVYFDDADLVYGDKTIVPDALVDTKLKFNDLLTALVTATGGTPKQYKDGIYREESVSEAKPGWMLKQDPNLAAKVKAKTDLAKKRQASYGDPSAGKKFNDNPGDDWSQEFERRMKKGVAETATAGATSAANVSVGAVYPNKKGKTYKNKDGTTKNALDAKGANLMTGGSIKRNK